MMPTLTHPVDTQYAAVIAGVDDGRNTWKYLKAMNQLGVTRGTLKMV